MHREPSSSPADQVLIDLGERSYAIDIGTGLLDESSAFAGLPRAAAALVVTNDVVAPIYLQRLKRSLAPHYASVLAVVLPDGEAHKSWETLNLIFDALLGSGCDRRTVLFALGGGVVGDMTGFAAAAFMRGVPFVQVPTTLLAQVDSSVGGKTAINHGPIKNPIGAFHHPHAVVVDPTLTASEPERGFRSALAELAKTALIGDPILFELLEQDPASFLARSQRTLRDAIFRALRVKASVVTADPEEHGVRAILNLGHTVGHAIEADAAGSVLHGEAVAMGIEAALELGRERGVTDPALQGRVVRVLRSLELPALTPLSPGALSRLRFDKKRRGTSVQLVLVRGIGSAELVGCSLDELAASVRKLGVVASVS